MGTRQWKKQTNTPIPQSLDWAGPSRRGRGRDSAERGYPEQKIIKSLVGVYLKVLARVADGAGGCGRAREGLRVRVAVLLSPPGPGRWGGGAVLPNRGRGRSRRVYGSASRLGLDAAGAKNS